MSRRPAQTLTDYLLLGINPALIMLLVGSLVFFLLEAFYHGDYDGRLRFIFAMYVMGSVCVARISIQEGKAYASLFAAPLAIVTAFAMARFVSYSGSLGGFSTLINWSILGLVWWSADRLTWDCTVIDESRDTTGVGLLQSMGWKERESTAPSSASPTTPTMSPPAKSRISRLPDAIEVEEPDGDSCPSTAESSGPMTIWARWFDRRRPRMSGVWVVYFSLAAIPLFGFGQWFIPDGNADSHSQAFRLLAVYLASALMLLASTSFLNLRKYLRHRQVEMPATMTLSWLTSGVVMILAILLVTSILPRPRGGSWIMQVALSPDDLKPSKYGFGSDGPKDSKKPAQSQPPPSQPPTSQPPQSQPPQSQPPQSQPPQSQPPQSQPPQSQPPQSQPPQSQPPQSQPPQSQPPQSQPPQSQPPQSQPPQSQPPQSQPPQSQPPQSQPPQSQPPQSQPPQSQPPQSQPTQSQPSQSQPPKSPPGQTSSTTSNSSSSSPSTAYPPGSSSVLESLGSVASGLGSLLRVLIFFAAVVLAAWFAWRNREQLTAFWRQLCEEWRAFWARLRRRRPVDAGAAASGMASASPPLPKFTDFGDPFATGMAQQATPGEVVQYTFQALEAWAREHGCPRSDQQTPLEFAQSLGVAQTTVAAEARGVAEWYGQLAYAGGQLPATSLTSMRRLWERLRS